MKVYKV